MTTITPTTTRANNKGYSELLKLHNFLKLIIQLMDESEEYHSHVESVYAHMLTKKYTKPEYYTFKFLTKGIESLYNSNTTMNELRNYLKNKII